MVWGQLWKARIVLTTAAQTCTTRPLSHTVFHGATLCLFAVNRFKNRPFRFEPNRCHQSFPQETIP